MKKEDSTPPLATDTTSSPPGKPFDSLWYRIMERRSMLKGLGATAVSVSAAALWPAHLSAEEKSGSLTRGDASILRFLAAAEIIESDLWLQYAELGGSQTQPNGDPENELPGLPTGGNDAFTEKLENLDEDMPQYIHDNTEDEITHFMFINAYLASKGADTVNLDKFRTLPSSTATGANQVGRLTNLMNLTVDTSWYTRYRSRDQNPDLNPGFVFQQAVKGLFDKTKFPNGLPAIPRSNADTSPDDHIQAIANTAGFHFGFIEQGGTSLYPSLAQRVTSPEVLRILLSIGGTEIAHFQTWHDKAGNAVADPLAPLTDSTNGLSFPNLNLLNSEDFQTNLIMPEPCPFLNKKKFPACSIIRPTQSKGAAMAALNSLMADGLFSGQHDKTFFELLRDLAEDADEARRENI